ncbi:MAG: hypothetical protein JJ891_06775 [Rhizobiaceae bacterium]|nr:hypothetical protein [Rhizobiaceae bacterium]
MIVWNIENRFMAHKADADKIRKERKLPPSELNKITINNRDELAEFLDGMLQYAKPDRPIPKEAEKVKEYVPDLEEAPDWIPDFIKEDWKNRQRK